uniref:Uncharacterized protein n=1 Tax=Cryptomonas curvata TaxID=233186 RepID=A0A7S0M252_9CRYP|mmetsp:Transcript_20945/g.44021  ORF Transcript_20945/g.44021 Transcript_20945/m.44021 type:complete len:122 (+) Transcript_20945:232-597(+)
MRISRFSFGLKFLKLPKIFQLYLANHFEKASTMNVASSCAFNYVCTGFRSSYSLSGPWYRRDSIMLCGNLISSIAALWPNAPSSDVFLSRLSQHRRAKCCLTQPRRGVNSVAGCRRSTGGD